VDRVASTTGGAIRYVRHARPRPEEGDPWLRIPAEDYEAHMGAIGQSATLRELFSRIYAERKPKRLAVLGCTTGSDLERVDPAVTETVVGVDINLAYLEIARRRLRALGRRLDLVHGDVLHVELPPVPSISCTRHRCSSTSIRSTCFGGSIAGSHPAGHAR
jgi:hypothetical protein